MARYVTVWRTVADGCKTNFSVFGRFRGNCLRKPSNSSSAFIFTATVGKCHILEARAETSLPVRCACADVGGHNSVWARGSISTADASVILMEARFLRAS